MELAFSGFQDWGSAHEMDGEAGKQADKQDEEEEEIEEEEETVGEDGFEVADVERMTMCCSFTHIKRDCHGTPWYIAWKDTVFQNVFKGLDLYIMLVLSIASALCRAAMEQQAEEETKFEEDVAYMSQTLALLHWVIVFFATFYNAQAFARWKKNWELTQVIYGRINDLNITVPSYLYQTTKRKRAARDIIRYVNAYHHIEYFNVLRYKRSAESRVDWTLKVCLQRNLLTKEEADFLRREKMHKGMRVLSWATRTIHDTGIHPQLIAQLNGIIVELRRAFGSISGYESQMLPYAYVHTLYLMTMTVLIAKSCLSGFDSPSLLDNDNRIRSVRVVLVVGTNFLYALVMLLLREIGVLVADPFSHGMNGINSEAHLDGCTATTSAMLASNFRKHVPPVSAVRAEMSELEPLPPVSMRFPHKDYSEETWAFRPRRKRDVKYLRVTRRKAVRLDEPKPKSFPCCRPARKITWRSDKGKRNQASLPIDKPPSTPTYR